MSEYALDYLSGHKKSARRFQVPEYLLLGAGPINASLRVRKAIATQCLNPMSTDMFKIMDEIKIMLSYLFQTKNRLTFAIQTSGNGGNETILTNLLDPGEKIVVAIGGIWGEKVVEMAQRCHLDILPLRKSAGEIYTLQELENAIIKHQADLLFVTHGESTGGIVQKLEGLGALCHKHNCLLAVDAIVSIGVEPLFVDRWEIDAVTAGSQKAIGAPPGMCMLSFSPLAEKRMKMKKEKPPYYFDVERLALYWNCIENGRRDYHYTFSSNMIAAIREALAQICEEGLDNMWDRHKKNTLLFWEKLEEIGLKIFVQKPENRFMGITCVKVPKEFDQMEFLDYLKSKHAIEITCGQGPTFNLAMRIGLMGENSCPEVVEYLVEALKDALKNCKRRTYTIDITAGESPALNKAIRVGLMGQNSRPEMSEYLIQALEDALQQCDGSKQYIKLLVIYKKDIKIIRKEAPFKTSAITCKAN